MEKQKILIAGATGLVGKFLSDYLASKNFEIYILQRGKYQNPNVKSFSWDLNKSFIENGALEVDHVINLCGAGIVDKRWTKKRKQVLIDSRVNSNTLLIKKLSQRNIRVKNYISASAIGIYGDRSDEVLTENSKSGNEGFMVECCRLWEESALGAKKIADHLSILRIGIVLSTKGGALSKFLLPIKLGQSNYFGKGDNYYSWIHIEDLCRIIEACVHNKHEGTLNAVSPNPIQTKNFMKVCRDVIAPYAIAYPLPKFFMRLFLGEMSATILNSNRVKPEALINQGFTFLHPNLDLAIQDLMTKKI